MPKSRKQNNINEEKKTAWRTPVKLPSIATMEPMKSLYASNNESAQTEPQSENLVSKSEIPSSENQSGEIFDLPPGIETAVIEKPVVSAVKRKSKTNKSSSEKENSAETESAKMELKDFLRLFKTEKMDFYSLAEILRGSSMALYCVLYSESLAKGENRFQIRQNELMMRVGINNPATLYKQERWLTALGLISKTVRLGNHNGASYQVRPLETLPLPDFILDQFESYLTELVN